MSTARHFLERIQPLVDAGNPLAVDAADRIRAAADPDAEAAKVIAELKATGEQLSAAMKKVVALLGDVVKSIHASMVDHGLLEPVDP